MCLLCLLIGLKDSSLDTLKGIIVTTVFTFLWEPLGVKAVAESQRGHCTHSLAFLLGTYMGRGDSSTSLLLVELRIHLVFSSSFCCTKTGSGFSTLDSTGVTQKWT